MSLMKCSSRLLCLGASSRRLSSSVGVRRSTFGECIGGRTVAEAASEGTAALWTARCGATTSHAAASDADLDERILKQTASDAASMAVPAAGCSSSGTTPAATANDSQGSPQDWVEPTLADLDRSIPQVDSKFIADLIRTRNARRDEFLREKEGVKSKIADMVRDKGLDDTRDVESALTVELSEEEKELLTHARPEYDDGFVLIDCRTVNEITSWGIIEGAKVLPSHELFEAFHMTPEVFEESFGFAKPRPDQTVIFYCQYGPRSLMAAQILSWMGYENVLHFRDGYHDWGKQYNLLVRRWMEHDKASGNNVKRLVAFEAARQLQREIAPEFNALPVEEVQRYLVDETRSRGTLVVGDGVRQRALEKLAMIAIEAPPTALPGTVDDGLGKGHLRQLHTFMTSATGVAAGVPESVAADELQRSGINAGGTMSIAEAQAAVAADMDKHLGRRE